ncbi:MAG: FtsQ-type POTRA domain-containing protein [Thermodesulfovibrio sp.]|nr:FtsQ-type POTRA domain-containing protein [Thermodesulfovibrio sp.]MCX7725175.1 FtsQ-type POTRA domain-containing protein [Thermodesulfovibrio sp.]MDW7973072.1 FtsQ-type POTRA domain-containing protein [Thermodesulfovibrio sp.]
MKSRRWIIFVFLLLIVIAGVLISKEFKIREIVIIGNKHLTENEIRAILSIKEENSIFYPSLKSLSERLKKTPWIKDVIIRRDLNGTLTVYIKESTPVAIVSSNEKYYLVDYEAQVLEDFTDKIKNKNSSSNTENKELASLILLPLIKDIDPFQNKETLTEAVNLINFINNKGLVNTDDKIIITGNNPDSLTLYINDFPIIVGKGDFETKFAKYFVVNAEIQKRNLKVQYIDLRVPDRVIVKPIE